MHVELLISELLPIGTKIFEEPFPPLALPAVNSFDQLLLFTFTNEQLQEEFLCWSVRLFKILWELAFLSQIDMF